MALPGKVWAQVFINEVSPSTEIEWVELYNADLQSVDFTGWRLIDGNNSSNDDLTLSGTIPPSGLVVFEHAKGWLNNSGDILTLIDNASPAATIDRFEFDTVTEQFTVGRIPNGQTITYNLNPSKGSSNSPPTETPTTTPTSTPTPSPTPTANPTSTPVSVSQITQAPTTKPTAKPKSKLTPTSTASPTAVIASDSGLVLGEEITSPSITESIASESSSTKPRFSSRILGFGAIAAGVILFLTAAVVAFKLK